MTNMKLGRTFFVRSIQIVVLFAALVGSARGGVTTLYSVGNSLTVDLSGNSGLEALAYYESSPLHFDYHVKCGTSLSSIVANPTVHCVQALRFGQLQTAFAPNGTTRFDAVSLQPFYGNTIREEVEAAKTLVSMLRSNPLNADTRVLIYAAWNLQTDGPFLQAWNQTGQTLDSPFIPSANTYQIFLDELRKTVPTADLLPVGHVLAELAKQMETNPGSVSGLSGPQDFYRDNIHASNATRYIAGVTAYSMMYGKSPVGLADSWVYNLNGYGTALNADSRATVQQVAWNVVQNVTSVPDPISTASILVGGVCLWLHRRRYRTSSAANV
jgi:hypothetical protein